MLICSMTRIPCRSNLVVLEEQMAAEKKLLPRKEKLNEEEKDGRF